MKKYAQALVAAITIATLVVALAYLTVFIIIASEKDAEKDPVDYLILVNKERKLPNNWKENIELTTEKDIADHNEIHRVEKETLKNFHALRNDLLDDGIDIELDSCYRSVEEQIELQELFTEEYGEEYVKKYVATPGYSEHHTGLAIDICLIKDYKMIDDNDAMIAEKDIFMIIHSKLSKYGFILRYPEGKSDITGYAYEPWHFRYVGSPEIAGEITLQNLTLEEYLEKH